jgi:phage-related holin
MINQKIETYLTVGLMFFYTILNYGWLEKSSSHPLAILLSGILYVVVVYLIYGIARMAYFKKTYLLWISGVGAFVVGYLFTGLSGVWSLLTGLSMILFTGTIVGRLTLKRTDQKKVFFATVITIIVFALAKFYPQLINYVEASNEFVKSLIADIEVYLATGNYSTSESAQVMDSARKVFHMMGRVMPALIVLNVIMQFAFGYLVFIYVTGRYELKQQLIAPFKYWKMPYMAMLFLLVAIPMRIFGVEPFIIIADNIIVFLTVFYSVTGLALIEFYLRAFKLSRLMRILFYLMIFFSQMIGLLAAALLGFIDSFTNWRNAGLLSFSKE